MALSRPIDPTTPTVIDTAPDVLSLDARRAQLRRRRRWHAIREWAGLAAATTLGIWLISLALLTLLGH
jgi:hypothetical protein